MTQRVDQKINRATADRACKALNQRISRLEMRIIFLHTKFRFETENAFGCQRFGFPLQVPSL